MKKWEGACGRNIDTEKGEKDNGGQERKTTLSRKVKKDRLLQFQVIQSYIETIL